MKIEEKMELEEWERGIGREKESKDGDKERGVDEGRRGDRRRGEGGNCENKERGGDVGRRIDGTRDESDGRNGNGWR